MSIKKFDLFENSHLNGHKAFQQRLLDGDRTFLGVEWRTSRDTVGIVAVQDDTDKTWTAFMGVADGHDQDADVQKIADYGARLLPAEAAAFFPMIKLKYSI